MAPHPEDFFLAFAWAETCSTLLLINRELTRLPFLHSPVEYNIYRGNKERDGRKAKMWHILSYDVPYSSTEKVQVKYISGKRY